jgi:hypothetical protein
LLLSDKLFVAEAELHLSFSAGPKLCCSVGNNKQVSFLELRPTLYFKEGKIKGSTSVCSFLQILY